MRIRVKFSKAGSLIYTGNLDLCTLWERAARRAELPLAYSKGFHPQPKIHMGAPLPLGFASRCELLEMRLNEDVECENLPARLNAVLPEGIHVLSVERIDDSKPALQTQVIAAEYEVVLPQGVNMAQVREQIESLLAAVSLPRERRSRRYDLRPLIQRLQLLSAKAEVGVRMQMRLRAQEGATGRPDEVLDALGIDREGLHIERMALIIRSGAPNSAEERMVT